ncbi:hypothetical protein OE749_04240 [Aestuariibacter sp. AA17]|uniref:Sel1 repeat family protein n=1 Tax=Fluctibacter corallii TaxID=2984329 RepID=A0ABT3A5R8_9ALTE|nr:hypothetical protein [Aestuariibacter sp. AA17]MCV2883899.1 hypothetical protein [Aestuariibacter sp. AA17]
MNRVVLLFIALSPLLLGVNGSTCQRFIQERLTDALKAQSIEQYRQYAYLLAKQGNVDASEKLLATVSRDDTSIYWLSLLAQMGNVDAHFRLGMLNESSLHLDNLKIAAESGHAEAQYELALLVDTRASRLYWLQKSADSGYLAAEIALYQWYLLHEDTESAEPYLKRAAQRDAESALLHGRLLWRAGSEHIATSAFTRARELGSDDARVFLALIKEGQRPILPAKPERHSRLVEQASLALSAQSNLPACAITTQFVATSLESFRQAKNVYQRFNEDERLSLLPMCALPPVWLKTLKCDDNWQNQPRLGCDIGDIAALSNVRDFSHVVVFAEHGKANVHNGIMYLDLADTYSVFVHELAHFAGFVDEYPLSSMMADMHCNRDSAPNLQIIDPETFPEGAPLNWPVGVQPEQYTKARTCNNHTYQAYKPVKSMTFMEYHDHGVIPPLYLQIWHKQLMNRSNLTPAFVNFSQYFSERGNAAQAQLWRERALAYQGQPVEQ